MDGVDLAEAWSEFKDHGDMEARNRLIVHYHSSLVQPIATKMGASLSSTVERGDLVSYGTFGLIDALDKFDRDKGVKFETYATARIRGAIFDELRSLDWVPRGVRARIRDMEKAHEELGAQFNRAPEDHEVAQRLGVNLADVQVKVVSLTTLEPDGDRPGYIDLVADGGADPEEAFAVGDLVDRVAVAVDSLSERAKTIIALYYLEQLTLGDIGDVLGVTQSRVCQMHGSVLRDLRQALIAA